MNLHVDWTRCDGHGTCTELLPDVLAADEWGYPLARGGEREPAVPEGAEERARHAVRTCPLMALSLVAGSSTAGHPRRR